MEKFSRISKKKNSVEKEEYAFDGKYLKIKDKDGWQYVTESDFCIMIVHLLDFDQILFRKEWIPPYQDRHPDKEFFLTMVSGTIDDGETPIDTLIRELQEEAGILLNTTYMNYEKVGNFFTSKGNSSKCHIYYVPLRINDYKKVTAIGDGTESENRSSTIKIDQDKISSLKPSDIITAYCIEIMKNKL